jgi:hypothetical protein
MFYRFVRGCLLFLAFSAGFKSARATSSFQAHSYSFPSNDFISTGIDCHTTSGSKWFTSSKNRKWVGVDSFGLKILNARIEDGKTLIIRGSAFGYYCDLLPGHPKRYFVFTEPISSESNINMFLKADHTTLFSENRFKFFKVNLKDSFRFQAEVPVSEFFLPKEANLIERGLPVKKITFYVSFQFPNARGKLVENWYVISGEISKRNEQGVSTLSQIGLSGPFGRKWDY